MRRAAQDLRVAYPIAIDNDYALWRAFKNNYWPALYFVDAQGQIRHHHFGEGDYEEAEMILQQLLIDGGFGDIAHARVSVDVHGTVSSSSNPPPRKVACQVADPVVSTPTQSADLRQRRLPIRLKQGETRSRRR